MRTLFAIVTVSAAAMAGGKEPGALFRKNCAACHSIPDPSLRTDRAWLGQIQRTS